MNNINPKDNVYEKYRHDLAILKTLNTWGPSAFYSQEQILDQIIFERPSHIHRIRNKIIVLGYEVTRYGFGHEFDAILSYTSTCRSPDELCQKILRGNSEISDLRDSIDWDRLESSTVSDLSPFNPNRNKDLNKISRISAFANMVENIYKLTSCDIATSIEIIKSRMVDICDDHPTHLEWRISYFNFPSEDGNLDILLRFLNVFMRPGRNQNDQNEFMDLYKNIHKLREVGMGDFMEAERAMNNISYNAHILPFYIK